MLKHKGIKLPRRERVVDYWPGMCSSCFQKTENLNSFVLYTAHKQEENIGTYGGYSNVRLKHTRVYEHPCRLCNRCRFPIKALAIGMLKSMIPAIIVGSLVYFTLHDYTKILWSGVITFLVAYSLYFLSILDSGFEKSKKNVIQKRLSNETSGKYSVLLEKEYLRLNKGFG